jgi:hypothetical protein
MYPRRDERVLDGIAGIRLVAQDGGRRPHRGPNARLDEHGEGVAVTLAGEP